MYEKVRHIRNDGVFNLSLHKQVGGFFRTTVTKVKVALNVESIDYKALYNQLNWFYYLSNLTTIFSDNITKSIAANVMTSIPKVFHLNLFINNSHNFRMMIDANNCQQNIVVKKLESPNRKRVKRRTPSPIRDALESVKRLKSFYMVQEEEKEEEDNDVSSKVPASLNDVVNRGLYKSCDYDSSSMMKEVSCSEDAEISIKTVIAPKLLESIILFQKNWVFVTQFEVYYRNNQEIDESATATLMDKYSANPVAKIKNKTEKGKAWYVVSIFWGKYEIFLTGGLCGAKLCGDVVPFLGPNVPLKELVDNDFVSVEILVNSCNEGVRSHSQPRSLRNWTKKSSSYEWACISKKFYFKDFFTVNPLNIVNAKPLIMLISKVLRHISRQQAFEKEDFLQTVELFRTTKAFKETALKDRVKSFKTIKRKIDAGDDSNDWKKLAGYMLAVENKKGDVKDILSVEEVVRFSQKVYANMQTQHKKHLNCYR